MCVWTLFVWQELVACLAFNDITVMAHMGDAKFDAMQNLPLSAGKQVSGCAILRAGSANVCSLQGTHQEVL